jgi:hypothetical protein
MRSGSCMWLSIGAGLTAETKQEADQGVQAARNKLRRQCRFGPGLQDRGGLPWAAMNLSTALQVLRSRFTRTDRILTCVSSPDVGAPYVTSACCRADARHVGPNPGISARRQDKRPKGGRPPRAAGDVLLPGASHAPLAAPRPSQAATRGRRSPEDRRDDPGAHFATV